MFLLLNVRRSTGHSSGGRGEVEKCPPPNVQIRPNRGPRLCESTHCHDLPVGLLDGADRVVVTPPPRPERVRSQHAPQRVAGFRQRRADCPKLQRVPYGEARRLNVVRGGVARGPNAEERFGIVPQGGRGRSRRPQGARHGPPPAAVLSPPLDDAVPPTDFELEQVHDRLGQVGRFAKSLRLRGVHYFRGCDPRNQGRIAEPFVEAVEVCPLVGHGLRQVGREGEGERNSAVNGQRRRR
mmetsp:Transcript_30362/g.90520  ORF Transcript_30362/g.90520 Transcript_30362/m.90520 type:complete len:239 (+) Transcript_30362:612-1328(+)